MWSNNGGKKKLELNREHGGIRFKNVLDGKPKIVLIGSI
jgi:hypothetical protein